MVPVSGQLLVQGWEQLNCREGLPPSLAGEAGGVRDTTSGLDLKGQVEFARGRY